MKITKTILCAVAATLALLAGRASAAPTTPIQFTTLSISGTANFDITNYVKVAHKGTNIVDTDIYVTKSMTFNNATIYSIISNAVANAASISGNTNVPTATLPADGYIAFSPDFDGYNGASDYGDGFFYVTNKTGFYFPLSGVGTHSTYYSWMELDTTVAEFESIGFYDNFNNTDSETFDENTQSGSATSISTALLFIHDTPFDYDDADFPFQFADNGAAIEIRGILTVKLTSKNGNITATSATLSGTGNIISEDYDGGEVTSAKATLTK